MTSASKIRQYFDAGRPLVEQWLAIAEQFAAMRDAARVDEVDWAQIKGLLKASILDEQDGGQRVQKLVDKADCATSYADLLSLVGATSEKNISRSDDVGETDPTHPQSEAVPSASPAAVPEPHPPRTTGTAATHSNSGEPTNEALAREDCVSVGVAAFDARERLHHGGADQAGVGSERSSLTRDVSSGGVESRHANTGNKPGAAPGAEKSSPATGFVRASEGGPTSQARAGVAPGPLEASPDFGFRSLATKDGAEPSIARPSDPGAAPGASTTGANQDRRRSDDRGCTRTDQPQSVEHNCERQQVRCGDAPRGVVEAEPAGRLATEARQLPRLEMPPIPELLRRRRAEASA